MKRKICTKCGIEKSINEFYKSGKYYNSECKQCKIKYNVDYNTAWKKIKNGKTIEKALKLN